MLYEVDRAAEFAPLKQGGTGPGSAAACRAALARLHASWLVQSGAELLNTAGQTEHTETDTGDSKLEVLQVEVSPLVSYAGEGLTPLAWWPASFSPLLFISLRTSYTFRVRAKMIVSHYLFLEVQL